MSVDLIVAHVISLKKLIVEIDFYAPQRGNHIVAALSVRPLPCPANNFKTTTIILPCIFTELFPLNHLVLYSIPVSAISLKVQKGLNLNLVHT